MLTFMLLTIVAVGLIFISETFKWNGFYYAALFCRILLLLYAMPVAVVGVFFPQDLPIPLQAIFFLVLACAYSFMMFVVELFTQQKVYKSFLDVPRQVMYKMGKHGKCYVLTEKQAKKAHEKGETVYIHAMARVTYKPKDEEPQNPNIDKGSGTDINGHTVLKTMQHPHQPPQLSEDALIKLKELREKLGQIKSCRL